MEEQKEMEKNNMPLHSQWTTNNITFCYEGEYTPKNLEKRQHQKEKEVYKDGSKNPGKNVGLAAVFKDATRRDALPEEASIYTAEMTAIKVALKEIKKRKTKVGSCTDSQSSMQAIESKKKNHPILNQIWHTGRPKRTEKTNYPL